MRLWRAFVRKCRESGLAYTLLQGFSSVVPGRYLGIGHFVVTGKEISPDDDRPATTEQCRFIAHGEADVLRRAGYTDAQLEERFSRGAMAVVVERGERVIACNWFAGEHSDEYWIRFQTPPSDVWMWDGWVVPELRGRGIIGELFAFAEPALRERGYSRIIGSIATLNRNSIRSFAKRRYGTLVDVSFIRALSWSIVKVNGRLRFGRFTGRRKLSLPVPSRRERDESHAKI